MVVQEVESKELKRRRMMKLKLRKNWMQGFGIDSGSWVGLGGSGTAAGE